MRYSQVHRQRGFSLIELMIAVVLGLILLTAVIQIFIGNRKTQITEQSVARVQESGRLAINFIKDDLRQAGFAGSGAVPGTSQAATSDGFPVDNVTGDLRYDQYPAQAIRVYTKSDSGSWTPAAPGSDITDVVQPDAKNGSDLIATFDAYDTQMQVVGLAQSSYDLIIEPTDSNTTADCAGLAKTFAGGQVIMLASPFGRAIFKVTSQSCTGTTTPTVTLQHQEWSDPYPLSFKAGTHVLKFRDQHIYYVADTGRKNAANQAVWSLYRAVGDENGQELVEGIEFLKLQYGMRLSTGNMRYGVPASADDNKSIVVARVGVLSEGSDAVRTDDDTDTYTVAETKIGPDGSLQYDSGKVLRRAFTTDVELRNRAQETQ